MKKKTIYGILGVVAVIVVAFGIFQGFDSQTNRQGGSSDLVVATTIFPLADIASNIGGEEVEVVNILEPGASPHTFEAKPSDIRRLQDAEVLFSIGHGLDTWTGDLVRSVEGMQVVTVDEGISLQPFMFEEGHDEHGGHEEEEEHEEGHHDEHDEDGHEHEHDHEGNDPHYWLSVQNAGVIAQNIAQVLSEIDPANKQVYEDNLEDYQEQLEALRQELSGQLSKLPDHELLVFHDSWSYFAREYNLEIAGVFEPSPGKEPTPQYLKELNDAAKMHGIKAVFTEPQLASSAVEPFVQDLGLGIYTLDPLGGLNERDSYLNLMRYNAQTIHNALTQ